MKRIVSRGTSKEAALYFDRVFPIDVLISTLGQAGALDGADENCIPLNDPVEGTRILEELVPGRPDIQELYYRNILLETALWIISGAQEGRYNSKEKFETWGEVLHNIKKQAGINLSYRSVHNERPRLLELISRRQKNLLRDLGFLQAPEWIYEELLPQDQSGSLPKELNFALSIRDLNLVNPAKLSWEQIIEFRKDEESKKALRQLRLFFQEELEHKDPSYVSDKLAALADEQDRAVKLWGFETTQKALSVAFTHKSILASVAGGMAATIAGSTLPLAAAAALVVPLGSFGLEFSKAFIDSAKSRTKEPTKFLTHLKRLGTSN